MLRAELDAHKVLTNTWRQGDREALLLQAAEYERRLAGLNHEASRIAAAAEKSVPVDLYRAEAREMRGRVEVLERAGVEDRLQVTGTAARIAGLEASLQWLTRLLVGAIVAAIVAVVGGYWRR